MGSSAVCIPSESVRVTLTITLYIILLPQQYVTFDAQDELPCIFLAMSLSYQFTTTRYFSNILLLLPVHIQITFIP